MSKRLAACLHCKRIEILLGFEGQHQQDRVLADWIERHRHGFNLDLEPNLPGAHPGGQVVPVAQDVNKKINGVPQLGSKITEEEYDFSIIAAEAWQDQLQRDNPGQDWEIRDEIKADALACFAKHNRPDYQDGRPCIDYKTDAKLLSHKSIRKDRRIYLCNASCPYEETVRIEKRWKAGLYK